MGMLKNELAVGILFFVGMIILGYFTIIMRDEFIETRQYTLVKIEFPEINGLQKSERVKMMGVSVGSVNNIFLRNRSVIVELKMYENISFYENYSIRIRQESLLSGKFVSIDPGTPQTGSHQNLQVNTSVPLRGDRPSDLFALVEDVLSENRSDIRVSVSNLREISNNLKDVTGKISRGEGTIGKLINEDQTQGVKELVKEVRDTVEDAREQAPITSFIRSILTIL
jgi:phospholipid/cholesterol/gamma-HCH transport system substrate-binding protein